MDGWMDAKQQRDNLEFPIHLTLWSLGKNRSTQRKPTVNKPLLLALAERQACRSELYACFPAPPLQLSCLDLACAIGLLHSALVEMPVRVNKGQPYPNTGHRLQTGIKKNKRATGKYSYARKGKLIGFAPCKRTVFHSCTLTDK